MIQVGELYKNIWGVVVIVTSVKQPYVFLGFLDGKSPIGVSLIADFKKYYTKLSSLEAELL
jgi:hypothetical protein